MTTQVRRRRRIWPLVLLISVIVMLVPASREFVLTYIGHAIAALCGVFVVAMVMLSKPPPPRRR